MFSKAAVDPRPNRPNSQTATVHKMLISLIKIQDEAKDKELKDMQAHLHPKSAHVQNLEVDLTNVNAQASALSTKHDQTYFKVSHDQLKDVIQTVINGLKNLDETTKQDANKLVSAINEANQKLSSAING